MYISGIFKSYLPFYRRLLKLAFPLVLTQAGQTIVQLVDNAMVGRVGTTELAAAAFANSVFVVVLVFGIGIFLGLTPLISHALGATDDHKVAGIIKNGFILTLMVMVLLTLSSYAISFFMPYMNQPEAVWKMAIPYYRLLTFSLLPFLMFMFFKQVGEGLNNTMLAMIATIMSNLINVFFNYLLIFGKMGFPEMGLYGAGLATLISRITMPFLIYFGFKSIKKINHYFKQAPSQKANFAEIKKILTIGLPIALQMLFEVSAFALSAIMMGWMGDVPLAAHQVAMGMASFTFMIANGVAMAATIRTSYQLGQKDYQSMGKVAFSAMHLVLGYMLLCGILFMLARYQLPLLFTLDPEVIKLSSSLLIIAALFQVFDGLQVVGLGILRGFSDVKMPMLIATISYLIIGIPTSYIFAFTLNLGPKGIWYGFAIGLATAGILLFIRIKKKIKEFEAQA